MTTLSARNLVVGYGRVQVLHGIDLDIEDGEIVAVLGANGAGKTTCMRALSGMIPITSGRIELLGNHIRRARPDLLVREGVAHVPEGRGTFAELTVEENLRLGGYSRRDREVSSDIALWTERFPRLAERLRQPAGTMSGGEQQMLAIARAMMSRPKLLLLDEPSMGLAPIVTRELFTTLVKINHQDGVAMLIVEQNTQLALECAKRAYILVNGTIALSGLVDDVRDDPALRHAYLGA